jgi:hypothetical protein
MLHPKLLYEKAAHKMLMKLTPDRVLVKAKKNGFKQSFGSFSALFQSD